MNLKLAALALVFTLASCTSVGVGKLPVKVAPPVPVVKPVPKPAPQGDITKSDKDRIKDLLDQAIKKVDCSDSASKDDSTCAKP